MKTAFLLIAISLIIGSIAVVGPMIFNAAIPMPLQFGGVSVYAVLCVYVSGKLISNFSNKKVST